MGQRSVFLDTGCVIALVSERDTYHVRAEASMTEVSRTNALLVTTRAVVLEIGAALAKPEYRAAAVELLDLLDTSPNVEVLALSEDLYRAGDALFRSRMDKGWSLTDCISFVVMRERGIEEALTTDAHFKQAGFRALLAEES